MVRVTKPLPQATRAAISRRQIAELEAKAEANRKASDAAAKLLGPGVANATPASPLQLAGAAPEPAGRDTPSPCRRGLNLGSAGSARRISQLLGRTAQ